MHRGASKRCGASTEPSRARNRTTMWAGAPVHVALAGLCDICEPRARPVSRSALRRAPERFCLRSRNSGQEMSRHHVGYRDVSTADGGADEADATNDREGGRMRQRLKPITEVAVCSTTLRNRRHRHACRAVLLGRGHLARLARSKQDGRDLGLRFLPWSFLWTANTTTRALSPSHVLKQLPEHDPERLPPGAADVRPICDRALDRPSIWPW